MKEDGKSSEANGLLLQLITNKGDPIQASLDNAYNHMLEIETFENTEGWEYFNIAYADLLRAMFAYSAYKASLDVPEEQSNNEDV